MSDEGRVPWPVAVSFPIRPAGESFSLVEAYALANPLRSAFPNNKHVEAKIRQSLQVLRDRGRITFDGRGRYRKFVADVRPSVTLDFAEASRYASRSQVARVVVEACAATNFTCVRCQSPLVLVPANAKLLDALCLHHHHEVQVKAIAGAAPDRLLAAAHGPMVQRLAEGSLPDYLIVSYDRLRELVLLAEFVDVREINATRLIARAPLGKGAKRAGWVGATIDLSGLERSVVVVPSLVPQIERWTSAAAKS